MLPNFSPSFLTFLGGKRMILHKSGTFSYQNLKYYILLYYNNFKQIARLKPKLFIPNKQPHPNNIF